MKKVVGDMSLKRALVRLFARNTRPGSQYLHGPAWREFQGLMAQAALKAWRDYQALREGDSRRKIDPISGGDVHAGRSEWRDGDVAISIVDGYSRDYDRYVTDIVLAPTTGPYRGRQHVIIDEQGNVLLNEWHEK